MFFKKAYYRSPGGNVSLLYNRLVNGGHLLIAGSTGSGKSVALNGIIYTILCTKTPATANLVLIDPKRVELNQYKNVPHCCLYASEPLDIINALKATVGTMEQRYKEMQAQGLKLYNGCDIYVIIDELADIMTTHKKQAEPLLIRLSQLGRAARIHLFCCSQNVLATTIPTTIKCNFPVILGLRTANRHQSRFLIDASGCELLPDPKTSGKGYGFLRDGANLEKWELLMYTDQEIDAVIDYWTSRRCICYA